ncbi:hypothetical protein BpHYR1_029092 [Brachionus plicatilis]|uniref:Uncharacterized protein n=1 Tax=Brachionus plicatilis TaxID=10195 RepID=A0A3M7Q464_BRAPC|nr:hypothetical protein BpHYR1_029092 [Brachionus plicatilis]
MLTSQPLFLHPRLLCLHPLCPHPLNQITQQPIHYLVSLFVLVQTLLVILTTHSSSYLCTTARASSHQMRVPVHIEQIGDKVTAHIAHWSVIACIFVISVSGMCRKLGAAVGAYDAAGEIRSRFIYQELLAAFDSFKLDNWPSMCVYNCGKQHLSTI